MNQIKRNLFLEKVKKDIKEDLSSVDQKIISYSLILEKIPNNINELYEQLRIICDQKYPTLDNYLDIENYCQFILNKDLKTIKYDNKDEEDILRIINSDISLELNEFEEKEIINSLTKQILELIKYKNKLEEYSEKLLKENYYNFYKIATPKIAIKMLTIAGSFSRLYKFPASTIQLLGSEKSFFTALRKNKRTPKYGIIYNHKYMQTLNNKNKAKFGRLLASKISIALKADQGNTDITKELELKLNNKLKQLNIKK